MLTYENVLDRARREVLDEITREVYLAEFVDGIRWYPETSRLLPPEHLNGVVDELVRAQRAGLSLGAIVNERQGFYPLVAKLARQPWVASLIEDSLPRVRQACVRLGRKRAYQEAVRRLQDIAPQEWMPALLEVTTFGTFGRSGYIARPYEPAGNRNHDLVIETSCRTVHIDCLCVTRTEADKYCHPSHPDWKRDHLDVAIRLLRGKIINKAPQLKVVSGNPRGVVVGLSGFGPDRTSTPVAFVEAICSGDSEFEFLSVIGVASGTACHTVVWFQNPRAEVPLVETEWGDLTRTFRGAAPVEQEPYDRFPSRDLRAVLAQLAEFVPRIYPKEG